MTESKMQTVRYSRHSSTKPATAQQILQNLPQKQTASSQTLKAMDAAGLMRTITEQGASLIHARLLVDKIEGYILGVEIPEPMPKFCST